MYMNFTWSADWQYLSMSIHTPTYNNLQNIERHTMFATYATENHPVSFRHGKCLVRVSAIVLMAQS